jgi:hypothetical protein
MTICGFRNVAFEAHPVNGAIKPPSILPNQRHGAKLTSPAGRMAAAGFFLWPNEKSFHGAPAHSPAQPIDFSTNKRK